MIYVSLLISKVVVYIFDQNRLCYLQSFRGQLVDNNMQKHALLVVLVVVACGFVDFAASFPPQQRNRPKAGDDYLKYLGAARDVLDRVPLIDG